MAKTATKRKEFNVATIKRRLSAALIMLLVSSVMLVATTYAWFTLSTAPEVRSIDTTVAGNGSLEIALVPANGTLGDIASGRGASGVYAGGNNAATAANTSWGNLVDLNDASYGLAKLEMSPAHVDLTSGFKFTTAEFGKDGRIVSTPDDSATAYSYNAGRFNGTSYGVRAFMSAAASAKDVSAANAKVDAYAYVIDLAFRANVATPLKLQQTGIQRIYNGTGEYLSAADETLGGGSSVTPGSGIIVAFVQNFADADDTNDVFLGYGIADPTTGVLSLKEANMTTAKDSLLTLQDSVTVQISAIIYREGANLTNAELSPEDVGAAPATVNLQFVTDAALVPSIDSALRDNPPAGKTALVEKIAEANAAYTAAADGQAKTDLGTAIAAAQTIAAKYNATQAEINGAIADLQTAIDALPNP